MFSALSLALNIFIWTLCVFPAEAWFWNRNTDTQYNKTFKQIRGWTGSLQSSRYGESPSVDAGPSGWNASASRTALNQYVPADYTFSLPSPSVIRPTATSQGMIATSIIPIYEVCNLPGQSVVSCSPVLETRRFSSCSAVITGFFTRVTVSDCEQSITFSSQSSYSLATITASPAVYTSIGDLASPSITTYVESVISYYIAPWQSLLANDPSGITVAICTTDYLGQKSCIQVHEVWVVFTEYVPVILTSNISVSRTFTSPVVLLFGPSDSLTVTAGDFDFSTLVEYTSTSANTTTMTTTIGSPAAFVAKSSLVVEQASTAKYTPVQSIMLYSRITSTRTKTRTIYVTKGTTLTRTLGATSSEEPTTTLISTTTLTKTRTVRARET